MQYRNILLIDDDIDDQDIFATALEVISSEFIFNAMADASIALEKLEAKELLPDVIFLDLNMPVMTGEQFLSKLKSKEDLNNIPVIIFSTSSHIDTIKRTKQLGACDFITKPNKFDELVAILQSKI